MNEKEDVDAHQDPLPLLCSPDGDRRPSPVHARDGAMSGDETGGNGETLGYSLPLSQIYYVTLSFMIDWWPTCQQNSEKKNTINSSWDCVDSKFLGAPTTTSCRSTHCHHRSISMSQHRSFSPPSHT